MAKKHDSDGITLKIVLDHIQSMKSELTTRIDALALKVDKLEWKVDTLEKHVDRGFAQTMLALDNIDARLDDLEVKEISKLKKTVGIR